MGKWTFVVLTLVVGCKHPGEPAPTPTQEAEQSQPTAQPATSSTSATTSAVASAPDAGVLPSLWSVPEFSFVDQDGKSFTRRQLEGHVWIADFIYTQCTSACPLLTAKMKLAAQSLRAQPVRYLSFSVDPENDSPQALREYATHWGKKDLDWQLLSTRPETLAPFAKAMRTDIIKADPGGIIHSERFVLIDQKGTVRGWYDSTSSTQMDQMVRDASRLVGQVAKVSPSEMGRELFNTLGCEACHADPRVAPPLDGLLGSDVMLSNRTTIKADVAYVRESIVEPDSTIVFGYGSTMPSYQEYLTPEQVQSLVDYLGTLKADAQHSKAAPRQRVVDPVCQMPFSAGPETLSTDYQGKTYWFCSRACQARFEKDPKSFLSPQDNGPIMER
jgi:protein SCO1/2